MGPSLCCCGFAMLRVLYLETPLSFSDMMRFVLRAGVLEDTTLFHTIWPCLIGGTEDALELGACCNVGVAACFSQSTFKLVGDATGYKGYFGVRS